MDFPSSLDDQQIEKKKKLSPRWGFLLLIAVLLGLNFYFLIFNGKNSEEMTKTLPQGKESNLGEWQIEALDQGKNWRRKVNAITKTFQYGGQTVTLETGRIARQATGAVMVTVENTSVLCTVVAEKTPQPGKDFFPLADFGLTQRTKRPRMLNGALIILFMSTWKWKKHMTANLIGTTIYI